jgi:hypothetical protein
MPSNEPCGHPELHVDTPVQEDADAASVSVFTCTNCGAVLRVWSGRAEHRTALSDRGR